MRGLIPDCEVLVESPELFANFGMQAACEVGDKGGGGEGEVEVNWLWGGCGCWRSGGGC